MSCTLRWRAIAPPTILATLLSLLLPVAAAPARAHSALSSAQPEPDGQVDQPVDVLTLVFGQPVDVLPESVQVVGPDGQVLVGEPTEVAGDRVTVIAALTDPLPQGTSTVRWRVIGEDGHPIEGSYTITSSAAPAPEPAPARAPEDAEAAAAQDESPDAESARTESTPDDRPPGTAMPATPQTADPVPTSGASEVGRADASVTQPSPGSGDDREDEAQPATAIGSRDEPRGPDLLQTSGRWLVFASIMAAVGAIAFGIAVHPESWQDQDVLTRVVVIAAAGIGVGAVLQLLGHVAVISGDGLGGITDPDAWRLMRGSGLMLSSGLRLIGAAIILLPLRGYEDWTHDVAHMGPMVVGSLALLASFQFTGHTATSGPAAVVRLADLAHVGAAAVWTGGVLALATVLTARHRRGDDSSLVVGRFSVAATGAVVLVGVAGSALALVELDSPSQLVSTSYGLILLGKLAIVAVVGAVGAFNHTRLVPAIVGGDAGATARMQRMMRLELALFPLAIALTALLVRLSP